MAKNTRAISDEEIIAALLQNGTVKAAAQAAGTTPRTIYDRMQEREFIAAYNSAKNDIIRQSVFSINGKLSEAINAVAEIMNDPKVNPATRLQAAQTILNNAGKFSERLAKDEKTARNSAQSALDFKGLLDSLGKV